MFSFSFIDGINLGRLRERSISKLVNWIRYSTTQLGYVKVCLYRTRPRLGGVREGMV